MFGLTVATVAAATITTSIALKLRRSAARAWGVNPCRAAGREPDPRKEPTLI